MAKTNKFRLPKGALSPKYWDEQPEQLSAFFTHQSQMYFREYTRMYTPEVSEFFDDIVFVMEAQAEADAAYSGWKALANQWCGFLNALIYHDESRFEYHKEANAFIACIYTENFGIYHRTLNIVAAQMDHMTFAEALGTWIGLRKAQPEDFKDFKIDDLEFSWATKTKLVDKNSGEVICHVDDTYWIDLRPEPNRDMVPIISIPMVQGSTAEN